MQRHIDKFFQTWRVDRYRKPLIVQGARQVGKTYSILNFAKSSYDNTAYFNFQTTPSLERIFDGDIRPAELIPLLSRASGESITKGRTLVVFDEVQLCERALTSLKYFCEEAPEYHVIAAGSLLGVAVNREKYAFPVGKVDRYTMHPMDLEEFLLALGEQALVGEIKDAYEKNACLHDVTHEAALRLYRKYLAVGGMPEAVSRFTDTGDFLQVRHVQDTILMDYLDDMSKYQESSSEINKTRLTYSTISTQLSKTNKRFQYKLIKKGARAAEYENAIQWLVSGNLISRIYRAEQVMKPLDNYKDIDDFKVYLPDMGLLCAQKGLNFNDIMFMEDELGDFKGGMTEDYVDTQLAMRFPQRFFWRNDKGTNEVDFIVPLGGELVPVEVKSGGNVSAASLKEYISRYKPSYAIRVSEKNLGFENGIKSVPLYAVFCID